MEMAAAAPMGSGIQWCPFLVNTVSTCGDGPRLAVQLRCNILWRLRVAYLLGYRPVLFALTTQSL